MKNSIEYLINEVSEILGDTHLNSMQYLLLADALKKSRQKHKQEIVDAFEAGYKSCDIDEAFEINRKLASVELYYNQTYNQNK